MVLSYLEVIGRYLVKRAAKALVVSESISIFYPKYGKS